MVTGRVAPNPDSRRIPLTRRGGDVPPDERDRRLQQYMRTHESGPAPKPGEDPIVKASREAAEPGEENDPLIRQLNALSRFGL